jgi:AcrR family transcriptional regulator
MPPKRSRVPRTPRQSRSKETVSAILDATERVLVAEGPKAVTTSRVAVVAGVSVGTLYEYFATKEALRRAVEERSWASILEVLSEKVVSLREAPVDDAIVAIVEFAMNAIAARGKVHGFTTDDPSTVQTRVAYVRQIAQVGAAGLVPHAARVRPRDLALALEIAIKAVLTLTWLGTRDHEDQMAAGTFQREVATMIVHYLLCDAAPPSGAG